jgi:alginate O-acetyltransferase algI
MLFNSTEFALFLPVVLLLYWSVFRRNLRLQNLFVLLASYLFYGWWDWRFLVLIAFTSGCSFLSGLLIERYRSQRRVARTVSTLNVLLNLGILATFKYYNFFVQEFLSAFFGQTGQNVLLEIILPVGISFYTFQALSYSIDIYRGKLAPTRDPIAFFAYIAFFPQLVAGPIERATHLLPQFFRTRTVSPTQVADGCRQILWGLFKKMVVADNCAQVVDQIFAYHNDLPASTLALGAVLFAFQIYGDFSGYSDIAVGTARLFGFSLMQNFRTPYFSRDIAEFWRRWHISLTTWFRDYLYIPLGGSRGNRYETFRNTCLIFLASGLWHGANWTFLAWGAFHALLFLPLILFGRNRRYLDTVGSGHRFPTWKEGMQMLATFILVTLGWILFRSPTIHFAGEYISRLFNPSLLSVPRVFGTTNATMLLALLYIIVMLGIEWWNREQPYGLAVGRLHGTIVRFALYSFLIVSIYYFGTNVSSFIYFQF